MFLGGAEDRVLLQQRDRQRCQGMADRGVEAMDTLSGRRTPDEQQQQQLLASTPAGDATPDGRDRERLEPGTDTITGHRVGFEYDRLMYSGSTT